MKISSSPSCIDVHDLPAPLNGRVNTDVILPNGRAAELHGCSLDAHLILQDQIPDVIASVPLPLPSEVIVRLAIERYQARLLQGASFDAA